MHLYLILLNAKCQPAFSGASRAVYVPIVGRTGALRLRWNCASFRDAGEKKAKEKKKCVCVFIRAIGAKMHEERRGSALRCRSRSFQESRTKEVVGKGKLQLIRKMMQEQEMLGVAGGHRESTALETTGR